MIAGFEQPDQGSIRIDGTVVSDDQTRIAPERRRVGMVFQDYALFPHLTVAQNVGFGLPRSRQRQGLVDGMLALVGLEESGDRYPGDLSGGQQQRVAVARALAPEPAILLLDEPFSNLDQSLRVQLRDEIQRILRAANATAVLVTHDQEEALSISDRVGVMIDGQLIQVGTPEEVHHYPNDRRVADFVGDARFLQGTADGRSVVTALGRLRLQRPATGPVDVLIRPEMVRIEEVTPAGAGMDGTVGGTVVGRKFHGRDQTVTVAVEDDLLLTVRASSYTTLAVGSFVTLDVLGDVVCFPRDATGSSPTVDR
jgi:iron(III) transport system ATP-binding protein